MSFKTGDAVQLKKPVTGRRFKGKIKAINNKEITVSLPNGLYVVYPENKWEHVKESEVV